MDEFYREKGIKREYSVARTPQQNGVAERKNMTLIEAARTMLADWNGYLTKRRKNQVKSDKTGHGMEKWADYANLGNFIYKRKKGEKGNEKKKDVEGLFLPLRPISTKLILVIDLRWSQIKFDLLVFLPFRILMQIVKTISIEEITSIKTVAHQGPAPQTHDSTSDSGTLFLLQISLLFGDSDFLLFEEADSFLALEDDPTSSEVDPTYQDPEGDILLLEAILNSEPPPPSQIKELISAGVRERTQNSVEDKSLNLR
ncbi:reverse transcriptase domain-containing protein [Tanacetum coccineum]